MNWVSISISTGGPGGTRTTETHQYDVDLLEQGLVDACANACRGMLARAAAAHFSARVNMSEGADADVG